MTDIAYVILAVSFIVTNALWIWFIRWLLLTQSTERWQLQERIREPEAEHVPIGDLVKRAEDKPKNKEPVFSEKQPIDELDILGTINPDLPLREDQKNGS